MIERVRRLLSLVLAAVLAGPAFAQHNAAGAESEPVRARVQQGVLLGSGVAGITIFRGIPYAAPPIGALRWALPQPAPSWSGDRDASAFGSACMQPAVPRNVPVASPAAKLSEDCLTLNVWAPRDAQRAPVMVWLHGGGNRDGAAADRFYDGSGFARDGVILVSLNYRLGVFGFLAFEGQANFGLWDQIAALKWVRANIAAFGGDPDNVTLFGESAGGEDVIALLAAKPARGLFAKAIVESGGGGFGPPPTLAQATVASDALLALPEPHAQSAVDGSPRDVAAAALVAKEGAANDGDAGWRPSPVIDGRLLTEAPLDALAGGRAAHVPLIIGTNGEEGSLLGPQPNPQVIFPALERTELLTLKNLYGSAAATDPAFAELLFRDGYFAAPAQWIAGAVSRSGEPAYLYRFDYVLSLLKARRSGAHHASEIPFVFDTFPAAAQNDADRRIVGALHGCWVAFARSGAPACAAAPDWQAFGADPHWLVFDEQPSFRPVDGTAALALLETRLAAKRLRRGN